MGFKISTVVLAVGCIILCILLYITNCKELSSYDRLHTYYIDPEAHLNTKISLDGYYSNSNVQEDGTVSEGEATYHFLTIFDEDACQSLTIEFTTEDNIYPEIGDHIRVAGIFKRYTEDDNYYYTVKANSFESIAESE